MTHTKKNSVTIIKKEHHSIVSSDAERVGTRKFLVSFCVQSWIKPVFQKKRFLFSVEFLDMCRKLLECIKKITRFMNIQICSAYFGGYALVASRYAFLMSALFEYSFRLSSGIKRTSFRSWSFISFMSLVRRLKIALCPLSFRVVFGSVF